jgi:hypothetical protein
MAFEEDLEYGKFGFPIIPNPEQNDANIRALVDRLAAGYGLSVEDFADAWYTTPEHILSLICPEVYAVTDALAAEGKRIIRHPGTVPWLFYELPWTEERRDAWGRRPRLADDPSPSPEVTPLQLWQHWEKHPSVTEHHRIIIAANVARLRGEGSAGTAVVSVAAATGPSGAAGSVPFLVYTPRDYYDKWPQTGTALAHELRWYDSMAAEGAAEDGKGGAERQGGGRRG